MRSSWEGHVGSVTIDQSALKRELQSCGWGRWGRVSGKGCGGLHEHDSHRLTCLNAWSPISGTVWEGVRGVALLKDMCYWRRALNFQQVLIRPSVHRPPHPLLHLLPEVQDVISWLLLQCHAIVLPSMIGMDQHSKTMSKRPITCLL